MRQAEPDFYVIAREPGAENPSIPTWACRGSNPAELGLKHAGPVTHKDIDGVPGSFQLLNLLTPDECRRLVELSEARGYSEDAAVSLPRSIRHNHSFTWIADDETERIIWQRCEILFDPCKRLNGGRRALGLNARFRFYRYSAGDYFAPHTDGAWPGSRVIDGELIANAYPDRWSQLSILLFLSRGFDGGATRFYIDRESPDRPARQADEADIVDVHTPLGAALCFPHGSHPLHCIHSSTEISAGSKYIVRSDVLFEL